MPSAATTEIEPSPARTAIEPVDPMDPAEAGAPGEALATPLAEADGEGAATEGAALGDGVVLAQAAASSAVTAIARIGRARCAIT